MIVDDFEIYFSVDEPKADATLVDWIRALKRMLRNGFDAELFALGVAEARAEGRRWLAKRRKEVGYGGYNTEVKVINALARMMGWELHFKQRKEPRPHKKALPIERFNATFDIPRKPHERRESYMRGRALLQYALSCPVRRSEVWRVREPDIDMIESTITIRDPAKGGKRRQMIVPRELWDPFGPFMLWMRWRPRVPGDPGAIWTTTLGRGPSPRVMHINSIYTLLRNMGKRAGVDVNFVVTRSSGLTLGRRAGASKDTLQYHAGHNDKRSIERYVDESQEQYELEFRRIKLPAIVPKKRRKPEDPK